uniref:Polyprotein P3 n=1 Tax=Cacopsylla melanoneura TaxID=428564 RepID=A0A8D8YZ93_9HEMI
MGGVTKGGQLANFVKNWLSLGAGPQLIKIITGYRIPFSQKPSLMRLRPPFPPQLSTVSSSDMNMVIQSLLSQRMITLALETSGFLCPMFLVSKGNGSLRPVFNLKRLNTFVTTKQFRLVNHAKIPSFLQRNDFMASVDLSQAYCHIPVHQSHQRFPCFVHEGRVYRWTCLPFGLASAPQAFAQLSNWVASIMRKNGIRTLVYLDDFLLAAQDPSLLQMQIDWTLNLLAHLGWVVNREKSILIPTQKIDYLGISWDTQLHRISLPFNKVSLLGQRLQKFIRSPLWSLKSAQSIIGLLNFVAFTLPLGRLHLKEIQIASRCLPLRYPHRLLPIPSRALSELRWYLSNLRGHVPLHPPIARTFMSTDASDEGWGAVLANVSIQGAWTQKQRSWHINQRELFAVRKAILSYPNLVVNRSVVLQSDNKTVVAYIRKQGGLRSRTLLKETKKLLFLTSKLNIHITPHYIPGKFNSLADALSRQAPLPDWHALPLLTKLVFHRWGVPDIDLFATYQSKVVPRYVSLDPLDRQAAFIDAFSKDWKDWKLAWVFPPPPLLPQVLHHLNRATGLFIVVAPRWQKTFWRADLKSRAIAPPFAVQDPRSQVIDLSTGLPPPLAENLMLEIWLIRGGIDKLRGGQRRKNVC